MICKFIGKPPGIKIIQIRVQEFANTDPDSGPTARPFKPANQNSPRLFSQKLKNLKETINETQTNILKT